MPKESLISPLEIAGKQADVGSDWHIKPEALPRAIDHLRENRKSELLFCMGDLFDAQEGQDTSAAINELLQAIAPGYEAVIFTPGNHDLRGRDNPWGSFSLPKNVHYPRNEAKVVTLGDRSILVADLFYDMQFVDPAQIGLSWEEVIRQYAESNDGKHFLKGATEPFKEMTENAAVLLQPNIDILATHSLPHPSLVTFRVPELTEEVQRLARESGLQFICAPEEDITKARRWNSTTAEGFRKWWNIKSIFMGSNVLEHPSANVKDGLWAVHGHHHRVDLRQRTVQGRRVNIATHQPNPWKWETPL